MSTVTDTPSAFAGLTPLPPARGRAGFGGALASEWTKIRSVRSTVWTLAAAIIVAVGISTLGNWGQASHTNLSAAQLERRDLVARSMFGIMLGQLVMVVFGALAVTSEYATGMIRTSLSAQPRRLHVFFAKLVVVAVIAFVVGEVISFASFLIGTHFWAEKGVHLSLSSHGALQAVIGGGLYLDGAALLAFGIGAALRHTAGTITLGVALLFVVTVIVNFMPDSWQADVDKYLPANAGSQVWATQHTADVGTAFGAWAGFGIYMLYAAVALLAGLWVFKKKDA
ncbi:ABC transporter permease subunit [Actinospica robiniae]|uniref:ABC transporter permease subunit n=1 Tax=Actinospica robiniae TaxID=304901 RepID=UPI00042436EE|nr:ABC transporter permease subunit [Actinospica robiniae]